MAATRAKKQQHRHYKTLIVLVASMTVGTFMLYSLAQISPKVTPLHSRTPGHWNRISIRALTTEAQRGFFHFRIDTDGRLFQSRAWDTGQFDRGTPGTVHVLLTCKRNDLRVSSNQAETLSRIISQLRRELSIEAENVTVDSTAGGVAERQTPTSSPHLRRT